MKETEQPSITDIYRRGATLIPADYLVTHQEADEETKQRVIAKANERRQRQNKRRLELSKRTHVP